MDVKSAFINGVLKEEIYTEQPEGFESPENKDYVWKLKKALYNLKQAPKDWYERLDKYSIQQGFQKSAQTTIFISNLKKINY